MLIFPQTDDVGVFGSELSNEYLIIAQAFGLKASDLRALSKRAIDAIFGGEEEKERLRRAEYGTEHSRSVSCDI